MYMPSQEEDLAFFLCFSFFFPADFCSCISLDEINLGLCLGLKNSLLPKPVFIWIIQHKKYVEVLEWVQRKVTKMIRGWSASPMKTG